ncbi:DotU family type IV/VI secretion system protein [Fluviispira vulneris]|uniref:DotU family type IV/VI secretion system protein n=1 Tax=Fluviispira vulneris TaxID=2763012 RepID=UPI001648B7C4|nr:DotU family type IV/VI secretion system protein [Fluviispira vulneris]
MSNEKIYEPNNNQNLINFFDNSIKKLSEILLKFDDDFTSKSEIIDEKTTQIKIELVNYFNKEMIELKTNRRTHDTQIVEEVIYLVVCLFDDILIHQKSEFAIFWKNSPLEEKIFGSTSGGHVIFDQIDIIIAQPHQKKQELIKLYYSALKIGFQGKYRQISYNNVRQNYVKILSEIIDDFFAENTQLSPPSFLAYNSRIEKYLKIESIYFYIKFITILTIGLLLSGDLCWFITNQFMLHTR